MTTTAPASALPLPPPACSTWAMRAPRFTTGSSPAAPAARSFCALKTPTWNAPRPATKPSSSKTCAGSAWTGTKAPASRTSRTRANLAPTASPSGCHLRRAHRAAAGRGQGLPLLLHAGRAGSRARPGRRRAPPAGLLRPLPRLTPRRSSRILPPASPSPSG
jgi:hypothetical protein